MALSIKTDDADRLARELVALTQESLTEAVTVALRERLERIRKSQRSDYEVRLRRIVEEYQAHVVVDPRSDDEIIGYDATVCRRDGSGCRLASGDGGAALGARS